MSGLPHTELFDTNGIQRVFITTIRGPNPNPSELALTEYVTELVLQYILFNKDIAIYQILYTELRDFRSKEACNLTQHSTGKLINPLEN